MISTPRRIAVLSDIHIGSSARSRDLCPASRAESIPDEQFCAAFEDLVARDNIWADHLIVSGDISSKAKHDEFLLASELIERWASVLRVPAEEIYFVPGNHDVDWAVQDMGDDDEGSRTLRWEQRYDPIIRGEHLFSSRMRAAVASLFVEPFATIWESERLLLCGLNSSAHDTPFNKPHFGFASPDSLSWLRAELSRRPFTVGQLRVFVVHHHALPFSDPYPRISAFNDFSLLANSDALQSLLREHCFGLLVHGHKHVPRFETILVSSDFPIHVLGAGSFSVDLESGYAGSFTNQFHLISIEGRLTESGPLCGTLFNWAHTGPNGWRPSSRTYTGIDHQVGFGYIVSLEEAKKIIQELVSARIATAQMVTWSELVSTNGHLSYLRPGTQMEALLAVAKAHRLKIAGRPPGDVVLYR